MHYVSIPIQNCLILQDLMAFVHRQVEMLEGTIREQAAINARQSATIDKQSTAIEVRIKLWWHYFLQVHFSFCIHMPISD